MNEIEIYSTPLAGPIMARNFQERSLLFAELAEIAYLSPKDAIPQLKKLRFKDVEYYDVKGAQSYRFQNDHDIVIACRGTEPTEFNDIAADLEAMPVKAETISRVHRGFKGEVDQLWPMVVEDLMVKTKEQMVWFCGHSLGAAMATIMASRCHFNPKIPNPEELYTYGSPRVGWPKYIENLGVVHHRWKNNNDIVTTVPPAVMNYRHHGTMHYLNTWGNVRKPTGWQMVKDRLRGMYRGLKQGKIDAFSDHSITEYVKHLKNYRDGIEVKQV